MKRSAILAVFVFLSACGADAVDGDNGSQEGAGSAASEDARAPGAAGAVPDAGRPDVDARGSGGTNAGKDWNGIVGTGQSLSVGAALGPFSTTKPFENLKLSLGTATVGAPPYNPDDPALSMVPLAEPIRPETKSWPSAYPKNIVGETFHTAMANEISSLYEKETGGDYVTVHSVVGESGQPMSVIDKTATPSADAAQGTSQGHAYQATLFEAAAISRLAKAQGKSYGVAAIVLTHGESDWGTGTYEADMAELYKDYSADIPPLTGQTSKILLVTSQQHTFPSPTDANDLDAMAGSTLDQWRIGVDHPGDIVCSGPKYQYPYGSDRVHLTAAGYDQLGEKYGQVYYEKIVLGHDWQPLEPLSVTRNGTNVTVKFHVPVPPLVWSDRVPGPHQGAAHGEWKNGRGFEVEDYTGTAVTIDKVAILDDSVVITCAADPGQGGWVRYAMKQDGVGYQGGTTLGRVGQLCDSDPFVGYGTKALQPNYAVAFELELK
jgi:hypothetical protein